MSDEDKTKQQLISELDELRERIVELQSVDLERRRVEQELAKNKAILTAAIECLPFDFFALDPDGRCILQNAASRRYYGNAIGKTAEQVCPDKRALPRWLEGNRRALAGEKVETEVALAVGGEQRNFYSVLAPIQKDDTLCGMLGVNVDITDRIRAEEALQKAHDELEERVRQRTAELSRVNEQLDIFRRFAEASSQGFGMGDLESRIAYVNPAMCRLMGEEKPEDVVGNRFLAYYPPEWKERRANEVIPILEREGHWEGELALLSRQGKMIPTLHHLFLLRDEEGRPFRRAVVVTDITERKRAEEALERERQLLWRMLQASDHERQIISYDIHDGLAQYLAAAGMQFQVHDALRENSPDEAKKAYETALELVRQSHSESRRLINAVRPPVIDENGIEMAISHLVHEQRRHGGPTIKFDSDVQFKRLPSILENAIYRIAQEALTNACKHSKAKRVMVTLAQEGQEVRLEVRDWGTGFDPESVEKGHFGLEGIRQRVRLLGGRLTIESTAGSGTTIQVVVPILEQQTEE